MYARDQLFATLDPTLRRLELPQAGAVVLADTVGFVSRLPHELVAAFRSTLQETAQADLLLHVIDAASPQRQEQVAEVEDVLAQIGAAEVPRLNVFNKIDLLEGAEPRIDRDADGNALALWLSAVSGAGAELLLQVLDERFAGHPVRQRVCLMPSEGRLRALLFREGRVLEERVDESGQCCLQVELSARDFARLRKSEPTLLAQWSELPAEAP